ncbi:MAG TPA: hypothetical protein VF535_06925 [Allosphingosinicella sp.]|jgi:hypothetical protein
MADFLGDVIGDAIGGLLGDIVGELIVKPLHRLAWAAGVAVAAVGSFGRFQIEPFDDQDEWLPEEGRPVLHTVGATLIGCGVWTIAIAALIRGLLS